MFRVHGEANAACGMDAVAAASHLEAICDADRRGVVRVDDRDDLAQLELLEPIANARPRALCGVALAPVLARQAPADLDGRQHVREEARDRKPDEAGERAAVLDLDGVQTEAVVLPVAADARDQLVALAARH